MTVLGNCTLHRSRLRIFFFFFSSRRRHTRCSRDWSSDVCSSDLINGNYVLNPSVDQLKESKLDLVVAGTADAVLMVESEAQELPEDVMLGAVMFGHRGYQHVIDAIIRLAERAAKEPRDFQPDEQKELSARIKAIAGEELGRAYSIVGKAERRDPIEAAKTRVKAELCPPGAEDAPSAQLVAELFKNVESEIVRGRILDAGSRIDGRDLKTVRPISAEVGVLPRTQDRKSTRLNSSHGY